jgi:energy-coupling factor transporter ATP-binding protein EcfA2
MDALKKLLIALATQVPLAGGLMAWRDYVAQNPIPSASLALLYELVVFVLAFGKKVWSRVSDKAADSMADWIWDWILKVIGNAGFKRRYMRRVIREHNVFNVSGLGLMQAFRLSLDQVFVELHIDPSNPHKFNFDPIAQKHLAGNRPIWDFLQLNRRKDSEAVTLAIIGPPGSGKTTLLKYLALTLAANRQRRYKLPASTPILLFLRDHSKAVSEGKVNLGKLAQDYFSDASLFSTLRPPAGWFEKQLERGRCMVLLDGLDEVADPEQRRQVSAWVDNQIRNYPDCSFILTARPRGYIDAQLERADIVLEVLPFNAEQVQKFIESWYLANEIVSSGNRLNADVREKAARGANDLMQRLSAAASLSALTVNPLLLTMIAMVHRYQGALPGTRVELYAEICEVLLDRWRRARGIQDRIKLKASQKLVVLRPLAAEMMERKLRDISAEEATPIIAPLLERVGVAADAAGDFLSDLQSSSGLILEREARRWSFAHLTFQEYLTAAHWLEQRGVDHDWGEMVGNAWWHETLRLYAAQSDATPLVSACLGANAVPALTLAADFLDESRELNPEVRREAEKVLIAGLESDDPDRRRLAAEVRLSRRLRQLRRIDERREIDQDYVTCAEYQIFLEEMSAQGKYHQPDHWVKLSSNGEAHRPVSGLRSEDAKAFCAWLTQRQGGTVTYRLPREEEARQHSAKKDGATDGALATWCYNNDANSFSLVGLTEAEEKALLEQLGGCSPLPLPLSLNVRPQVGRSYSVHQLCESVEFCVEPHFPLDHRLDRTAADLSANEIGRLLSSLFKKPYSDLSHAQFFAVWAVLEITNSIDRNPAPWGRRDIEFILRRGTAIESHYDMLVKDILHIKEIRSYRDLDLAFAVNLVNDVNTGLGLILPFIAGIHSAIREKLNSDLIAIMVCEMARLLTLKLALLQIVAAINKVDQSRVFHITDALIKDADVTNRFRRLLDGISSANADHPAPELLVESQEYILETLKFIYKGCKELKQDTAGSKLRRLLRRRLLGGRVLASRLLAVMEDDFGTSNESELLNLCWWLEIVLARQKGKLPSWEGIRIVREEAELSHTDRKR